jgi:hypothetical protein
MHGRSNQPGTREIQIAQTSCIPGEEGSREHKKVSKINIFEGAMPTNPSIRTYGTLSQKSISKPKFPVARRGRRKRARPLAQMRDWWKTCMRTVHIICAVYDLPTGLRLS